MNPLQDFYETFSLLSLNKSAESKWESSFESDSVIQELKNYMNIVKIETEQNTWWYKWTEYDEERNRIALNSLSVIGLNVLLGGKSKTLHYKLNIIHDNGEIKKRRVSLGDRCANQNHFPLHRVVRHLFSACEKLGNGAKEIEGE